MEPVRRLLLTAIASLLVACQGRTGFERTADVSAPCASSEQCAAGQVCSDEICRTVCDIDNDCGLQSECVAGACTELSVSTLPPVVTAIDGTGTVDGTPGQAERHLRDRLVILGERLWGANVRLTGVNPASVSVPLTPCGRGSNSRLEMALPPGIVPGEYTLSVVNQAGGCDATLRLLQGEPGPSAVVDAIVNDGNAFAAPVTIGTNDEQTLSLETNNTPRLTIDAAGNVGVGTPAPVVSLDVDSGSINAAQICDENNTNCLDLSAGVSGGNPAYGSSVSAPDEAVFIADSGDLGVGTTAPRAALDVNGAIVSRAAVNNTSATTIDFALGNVQFTNDDCQPYAFHNLKDGGTYNFVVKGTNQTTCSFTAFSDAGVTALNVQLPAGHGTTTAGENTIYTIMVVGSDAYFAWVTAFD